MAGRKRKFVGLISPPEWQSAMESDTDNDWEPLDEVRHRVLRRHRSTASIGTRQSERVNILFKKNFF